MHCFAPNVEQYHVINHITGEEMEESRSVLVEAARIARGNIEDVEKLNVDDYDALLVPGGFGAAKNLTDFASMVLSVPLTLVLLQLAELSSKRISLRATCALPQSSSQ
ncbi:sigma cross-reacting protein 27A [Vibrio maritimus]|uniref:Sigma cross-reacting protein 27A n=1 Tax=Vibrio maritimus TaxID=990268 RepID=A0A090T9Q4_9VIBR|nr:sigma cross-reacting protein 27A [Vibrio maritimus]